MYEYFIISLNKIFGAYSNSNYTQRKFFLLFVLIPFIPTYFEFEKSLTYLISFFFIYLISTFIVINRLIKIVNNKSKLKHNLNNYDKIYFSFVFFLIIYSIFFLLLFKLIFSIINILEL